MRILLFLTALFIFGKPAICSTVEGMPNSFSIDNHPKWVVPVNVPEESDITKYEVSMGYYNTLVDIQHNLVEDETYYHIAGKILTQAGVDPLSQLSVSYDTIYQELVFHKLRIHRRGEVIDRTEELTFESLANESGLANNTYYGLITAFDILNDIRKGDIVEMSYTIKGWNPIYKGERSLRIPTSFFEKADRIYRRILLDPEKEYVTKGEKCEFEDVFEEKEWEGYRVLVSDVESPEELEYESSVPPWYNIQSFCMISTTPTWEEMGEWAEEVFDIEDTLDYNLVYDEVFYGDESEKDKIKALIDFVQRDIRYMGVQNGIGSHQPTAPSKTLEQRYGDCKDKTLLLVRLFRNMGLEAYPLLVNTTYRAEVQNLLPTPLAFDHVIVFLVYEGEDYFVDATDNSQAGRLGKRKTYDFGAGFVVGQNRFVFSKEDKEYGSIEVTETFDISGFEESVKMTVNTIYKGADADYMRSALEYTSLKDLSDNYVKSYAAIYPHIEADGDIKIEEDENENIIKLQETYLIPKAFQVRTEKGHKLKTFHYEPISLSTYIGSMSCEKKSHPVYLGDFYRFTQNTVINIHSPVMVSPNTYSFQNDGFEFDYKTDSEGMRKVMLSYDYRKRNKVISNEEYQNYCADMNRISELVPFELQFPVLEERSQPSIPAPPRRR